MICDRGASQAVLSDIHGCLISKLKLNGLIHMFRAGDSIFLTDFISFGDRS